MTKRGKELSLQRDYEQALRDVEKTRPEGIAHKIFSENGSQAGRMLYLPKDDTLTIEIGGNAIATIRGEYLNSIFKSLKDLLSDEET